MDHGRRVGLFFCFLFCSASFAAGLTLDRESETRKEDPCLRPGSNTYLIGSGIYDITGPAAELGMVGYARLDQRTKGLHSRLWSRAFVIESPCNGKRVVIVVADLAMIPQAVKLEVVARLQQSFGDLYNERNVILTATHTHSGPGGYSHYALYNLTILGFDQQVFEVIVDGIYRSIGRAHDNVTASRIKLAVGELLNAGINRSPEAYDQNPQAERALYDSDTDTTMTLLRFESLDGSEIGAVNWFPLHATSMGNQNHLISGDNKGYASYLFEQAKGANYLAPRTFVAAFAQGNEGDLTPNIFGGAAGEGADDIESTRISGEKQFRKAWELYQRATEILSGAVDYRHAYVRMDEVYVEPEFAGGAGALTCPAALGLSMLAGAEDGPGFGKEGWSCEDAASWWHEFSCSLATTPCQAEKPLLLEMGQMRPFPWSPEVLPLQLVSLGDLVLVAVPFEMTTMAGRRLRRTVAEELSSREEDRVVIVGLANAYAGYVATREEYAIQHYEGASTHFGPWTLAAVQQETAILAAALENGAAADSRPRPRDLSCCQVSLQPGVLFDDKPLFKGFGSVYGDARSFYTQGETVEVVFWGGHPKNDLQTPGTYLEVQRREGDSWRTVARDWDWSTEYEWQRNPCFPTFACSLVAIRWHIPPSAPGGTYRILHHGHWKSGWDGKIRPYTGSSRPWTLDE